MNNVKKITLLGKNNRIYEAEILRHENMYKGCQQVTTNDYIPKNPNSYILAQKIKKIHFLYNKNKSKINSHIKKRKKLNITKSKSSKDEDDMKQNENYNIFMDNILKDNNKEEKCTDTNDIDSYFTNTKKENNCLSVNKKNYYDNKFISIRKLILGKNKVFGSKTLFKLNYNTKQIKLENYKGLNNVYKKYFSTNRIHSRNSNDKYKKSKNYSS